jgi:hypothetical protein
MMKFILVFLIGLNTVNAAQYKDPICNIDTEDKDLRDPKTEESLFRAPPNISFEIYENKNHQNEMSLNLYDSPNGTPDTYPLDYTRTVDESAYFPYIQWVSRRASHTQDKATGKEAVQALKTIIVRDNSQDPISHETKVDDFISRTTEFETTFYTIKKPGKIGVRFAIKIKSDQRAKLQQNGLAIYECEYQKLNP